MILGQTHVHATRVDFDLLDAGNVVYHPNYFILCERARHHALRDAGCAFEDLWTDGAALAVIACTAKFARALELNQSIHVVSETLSASGTRLSVRQRICAADLKRPPGFGPELTEVPTRELFFDVTLTLGFVKLNPLKAARLPEKLVTALGLGETRA